MSTNVIKQTLVGEPGMQTIKQIVRSNERGPQGPKGDPGPQGPQGLPGERGADGVIQYRAGTGINISDENIISATGDATSVWGGIEGDIAEQADLAPYIKNIAPERIWYGVCNTAAGQTQKVVTTATGDFGFNEGDALVVFFNYAHTKSNYTPQLVVDGGTPTSVFFTSDWQEATNTYWANAEPVMFVYHQYYGINRFYAIGKAHASTTTTGVVRLYNDVDSTSTIMAPTANALKTTYDAIDTKITTALAGTGYVGTTNIADSAVTAAKIANSAVTTDKISDTAVNADKIDLSSLINNPDFIKVGTFTAVYQEDNSSGGFKEIAFSSPFPSGVTPVVFVNNPLTTGRIGTITITSVTNSKFDVLARHSGTGSTQSFDFYYIAINPNALCFKGA